MQTFKRLHLHPSTRLRVLVHLTLIALKDSSGEKRCLCLLRVSHFSGALFFGISVLLEQKIAFDDMKCSRGAGGCSVAWQPRCRGRSGWRSACLPCSALLRTLMGGFPDCSCAMGFAGCLEPSGDAPPNPPGYLLNIWCFRIRFAFRALCNKTLLYLGLVVLGEPTRCLSTSSPGYFSVCLCNVCLHVLAGFS